MQHDIVWEDPPANFERLTRPIAEAAAAGARLVVLSELFSTGFTMATKRTAEPFDGPSTSFLVEQAQAHDLWVMASVPELPAPAPNDGRPHNQLVVAAPGGVVARYAKVHLFDFAGESSHYSAGDGKVTVDIDGTAVTPFVCFDLRFPELFRDGVHATEVFVVVANWPATRRNHWRSLLVARAIENQAYVVGVNRVGHGGGLDYAGDSCIVDPMGEIVASAGSRETTLVVDVDAARVARTRAEFPFLPRVTGEA